MILAYTLTGDEVLAGCRRRSALLQTRSLKSAWVRAMPWLAAVLFLFAMFQLWGIFRSHRVLIAGDIMISMILLVLAMVAQRRYMHIATNRLFRHLAHEIHAATGEQRVQVEADSITLRTVASESKYDRSLIDSVVLDRKTLLLHIFLKGGSSIVVPRRHSRPKRNSTT